MNSTLTQHRTIILISALVFYFFLFDNSPGINILMVTAYASLLFVLLKKKNSSATFYLLAAGTFISAIAVLLAHTGFSIFIFWCCFLTTLGNFAFSETKHLQFRLLHFLESAQKLPATLLIHFRISGAKQKVNYGGYARFIILPIIILVTVFSLYASASDPFSKSANYLGSQMQELLMKISFERIFFFLLGVAIFGLCFVSSYQSRASVADKALSKDLVRRRGRILLKNLSRLLLRKKEMSIVPFLLLNLMILWLNILDIQHIWFGFNWDGGYLKEMVHEGTYFLILALLMSISVSVYYLNSNIPFFKNNRFFNILVTLWLFQNLLMVASVAIRNSYYINYFALAYLRIFVFFFLAACVIGIVSIMIMIWKKKSVGYLMSVNSVSVFSLILLSCCFNWDAFIARYNFAHYNTSFVHYNFLSELNDSALPYMNFTEEQVKQMNAVQSKRFSFSESDLYSRIDFPVEIKKRKEAFKKRWESRNFFEWNYPEARAYKMLFD